MFPNIKADISIYPVLAQAAGVTEWSTGGHCCPITLCLSAEVERDTGISKLILKMRLAFDM